ADRSRRARTGRAGPGRRLGRRRGEPVCGVAHAIIAVCPMYVSAIIAAGGRGRRLGGQGLKQLLAIGGRPILERSVSAFLAHPAIDEVIVALPAGLAADPPEYLRPGAKPLRVVAGGERRQDSVAAAFRQV